MRCIENLLAAVKSLTNVNKSIIINNRLILDDTFDDTTDNILYDSQMSSRSLDVFYPMLDI